MPADPYAMDPDASSTSVARRFVSSSYSFRKKRSVRPKVRQSILRISSPGAYARCSMNSVDDPRRALK